MVRKYRISDWMLERYVLNEVTEQQRKIISLALKTNEDSVCERIKKIHESNHAILNRFPTEQVTNEIQDRLPKTVKQFSVPIVSVSWQWLREFLFGGGGASLRYCSTALAALLVVTAI